MIIFFLLLTLNSAGVTTLSASGVLVDQERGLVITTATLLSPFLQYPLPKDTPVAYSLKKGTEIHILTETELYPVVTDPMPSKKR
jgi:hypothetical protein